MQDRFSKLNIIFHHPRPITDRGISGSQVRPYKILEAFKQLGVRVCEVTGDIRTRSAIMRDVKERILNGEHFDFVYSENLTIPFAMSEAHRLPLNPFIDHRFLSFCSKHGIPVAMFNRDVYWRDESYKTMLPWWGRMVTIPLYWYDWWRQIHYLKVLYLPSEAMARVLPRIDKFESIKFLPPGAEIPEELPPPSSKNSLRLFYVGGIEPPTYDLRPLLSAIRETDNVSLTICCRETEWNALKTLYDPFITQQVSVVHKSGRELISLYQTSDLFAVVRGRGTYLDYAVPIKIYEALGYALPILSTPGGETSRIVESEALGWVKETKDIPSFLHQLIQHPDLLERKKKHVSELRHQHTWLMRAAQVCRDMVGTQVKLDEN